jgi:uncharacterized protein
MMRLAIVALLFLSNCFMTYAWYGHLKDFKHKSLLFVIFFSWGVAFFEYVLQVPANRWGSAWFTSTQLKTIQEVVSLTVFVLFSYFYLREPFHWQYLLGFALIGLGAFFIFYKF